MDLLIRQTARLFLCFTPAVVLLPTLVLANGTLPGDLLDYSIEQLMAVRIDVTSAARKPQAVEDTAAAIHVITQEDIRLSGLTSLPEVLRLAPGLQIARIDGGTWAISSRGFNAKNSDNLLVMLDGRTIYSPTFTGVYWDAQDVPLADVERIEVIRGPGGALWGANAVTGVINIITRPAAATQGGRLDIGAGTHERQATVRHGGKLGEGDGNGHYRIYARRAGENDFKPALGNAPYDRNYLRSAGFRADWRPAAGSSFTLQGDIYEGLSHHTGTSLNLPAATRTPTGYPIDLSGGNLLARWTQVLSVAEQWSLQFYHDRYERNYFNLGEKRATTDLDFQHRLPLGSRHDVVWGLGYRTTADRMDNSDVVYYTPSRRRDRTFSAFVQDDIALSPDKFYLIAGAKLERNDYTGTEFQPNLRLRWKIDARQTAWAAVSRAVHTPSRTDVDGRVASTVTAGPTVFRLQGNPAVQSEKVNAYEAGWRIRPDERSEFDIVAFRNEHRDMMTIEREATFIEGPYTIRPLVMHNKADATTHGLSWAAAWQPDERWRFKANYTWLDMKIWRKDGSTDTSIETEVGRSPRNQAQFHVFHFPRATFDISGSLYWTEKLPSLDVPSFLRLDVRIAWRPRADLEIALTGRNLTDPGHIEFVNVSGPRTTEIPRSLFLSTTWRF